MSLSSLHFNSTRKPWARAFSPAPLAVDIPLLLTILVVAGLGMIVLYSAAGESSSAVLRQLIRLGVGLAAFFTLAQIPPHYLRLWTPWIFLSVVGMLLIVMVAGDIGCTVKMKNTKTNNTLTSPDVSYEFENVPFPEPKFRVHV